MPIEKITDENGDTMTLLSCNGGLYSPAFSEESIANMRDFPLREDDVLLCSYPKSGCHWVWEVIRSLLAGKLSSGNEVIEKEDNMVEYRPHKDFDPLPSPRVLNTHMMFDEMPRDLLVKRPRVVFLYRNIKDVTVSFYHHHKRIRHYEYNGTFEGHLKLLASGIIDFGSPFDYLRGWEKGIADNPDLRVFIGSYEDMKENNLSEVRRLSAFLGQDHTDDFLQQVCDFTSFDNMKKLKEEVTRKDKEGKPIMYRKGVLNYYMFFYVPYRSGQVGDWKNYFTVALDEWFSSIIEKETADSKLKFRYTL